MSMSRPQCGHVACSSWMRCGKDAAEWAAVPVCKVAPPEMLSGRFYTPGGFPRQRVGGAKKRARPKKQNRLQYRLAVAEKNSHILLRRLLGEQRTNNLTIRGLFLACFFGFLSQTTPITRKKNPLTCRFSSVYNHLSLLLPYFRWVAEEAAILRWLKAFPG
jgi:hypothetical protein